MEEEVKPQPHIRALKEILKRPKPKEEEKKETPSE